MAFMQHSWWCNGQRCVVFHKLSSIRAVTLTLKIGEEMAKQKSKDRRNWRDHTLVFVVVTLLPALIVIIAFITGKDNLPKFWGNSQTGMSKEEKNDISKPSQPDSAKSSISKGNLSKTDSVGSIVNITESNVSAESKSYRDSGYIEPKADPKPIEKDDKPKSNFQRGIAVLIREKIDGEFDYVLGHYFSSKLEELGIKEISVTQLEKLFEAKSKFNSIYEDGLLHNQQSHDYQGFLFLGILEKHFKPSDVIDGSITADVTIQFRVISLSTGDLIDSFFVNSHKPGVTERQAYENAIDALKSDYTSLTNSIQNAN